MLTQADFPGATAEWKSATFPAGAIGQANVKLRFLYSGSYYHWAIDDITVFKPSINNLSINNARYTTFGNTSPEPPLIWAFRASTPSRGFLFLPRCGMSLPIIPQPA
jgi:hypothetical protein